MGTQLERPRRSDARRNRARLIEVAGEAFRAEGLDIGVDEIARRAGVGVATLYRHFPAKTDLIVAVMDGVMDELQTAAVAALESPRPELVPAAFLNAALAVQCQNRGFIEALSRHELPAEVRDQLSRRALTILEPVVAAGHATGTIRPELDAVDLLMVLRMLGTVSAPLQRRSPEGYVAMLLRGLGA